MDAFDLDDAVALLRRTPAVLRVWLEDLPASWTSSPEAPDGWSAFDVVGHLIHGERTDWMPRLGQILDGEGERSFEPFDRFAMFEASRGKSLGELLDTFADLRAANVEALVGRRLTASDLERTGLHPELGPVTVRQLLATWTAHDMTHLGQIARVLAKRYRDEVGPWRRYLPLLDR